MQYQYYNMTESKVIKMCTHKKEKAIKCPKLLIKTTRVNSESEIAKIMNNIIDKDISKASKEQLDDLANKLATQLHLDSINLDKGSDISDTCISAPHIISGFNRSTNIVSQIAKIMFKANSDDEQGKAWSVIQYGKLLTKLRRAYRIQEKKKFDNSVAMSKESQEKIWHSLKNNPVVSDNVKNPTAMPVDIASEEELEPFMKFLSSDEKIIPTGVEKSFVLENCIKFTRGALYPDGRLDLCKQVVGPTWIEKLMESLKTNTQITHFLLGNNIIGARGAAAIAKYIEGDNPSKIQTWYIAGNSIDHDGMALIAKALEKDKHMKYLWLKRNPLSPAGIYHIGNMLRVNNNIKILDLHNTAVYDEGVKYLCDGLKMNKSLAHLYLDANALTDKSLDYLIDYFNYKYEIKEKGITSLWMSMNNFTELGMVKFLDVFKKYPYIKRLFIDSNGLTEITAEKLYDVFHNNTKLKVLSLGRYKSTYEMYVATNKIGNKGAVYIAKLLTDNKHLLYLDIMHNDISSEGMQIIENAIHNNDTLLYMRYGQHGIDPNSAINKKINKKLDSNILNANLANDPEGILHQRYLRSTKTVRYIDSIYRNNM